MIDMEKICIKVLVEITLDTQSQNNVIKLTLGVNGEDTANQMAFAIKEQIDNNYPDGKKHYLTFEDIFHKKWLIDRDKILAVSIAIRKKED